MQRQRPYWAVSSRMSGMARFHAAVKVPVSGGDTADQHSATPPAKELATLSVGRFLKTPITAPPIYFLNFTKMKQLEGMITFLVLKAGERMRDSLSPW